jgi:hypothetical protein
MDTRLQVDWRRRGYAKKLKDHRFGQIFRLLREEAAAISDTAQKDCCIGTGKAVKERAIRAVDWEAEPACGGGCVSKEL